MSRELRVEYPRERFLGEIHGCSYVFFEFLAELFKEIGFPSMKLSFVVNVEKGTKTIVARWEE